MNVNRLSTSVLINIQRLSTFHFNRPLLYSLEIKEEFKELRSYEFQSKDYQARNYIYLSIYLSIHPLR